MNDLTFTVLFFVGIAVPIVLVVRWLGNGDAAGIDGLFASPTDLPWPRGVQEEEPARWKVELIDRRRTPDASTSVPSPGAELRTGRARAGAAGAARVPLTQP